MMNINYAIDELNKSLEDCQRARRTDAQRIAYVVERMKLALDPPDFINPFVYLTWKNLQKMFSFSLQELSFSQFKGYCYCIKCMMETLADKLDDEVNEIINPGEYL